MSGLINKVKESINEHKEKKEYEKEEKQFEKHEGHHHQGEDFNRSSNHGTHDSNLANKADPRFDSDRDHRADPTSRTGGYGNESSTYGRETGFGGNTSTNHGPHDSNLANKADPRFDSDRDNRADPTSRTGGYGNSEFGNTSSGYGNTSSNHGPHDSNLANKADPRFDSDRDGRSEPHHGHHGHHGGAGSGFGGQETYGRDTSSGFGQGSSNHGPHDSNFANAADPRVDSDRDGRAGFGQGQHATPGSGRAQETAGPHNSNLLNKADPRVDSDMDGSKTYGGNQTRY